MKYMIYNNFTDFESKNIEIIASGVCGNALQYANINTCKHPQLNLWAMPVLPYVNLFFNENELINQLSNDWFLNIKK